MIYITGDIHGHPWGVVRFARKAKLSKSDTIILLGDVGVNYYLDARDREAKHALNSLKPTIFCIHGNHECRPQNLSSYKEKEWNGGVVWYEEEYPTLLFAKDGEIFNIEGTRFLVVGGAYSVDKHYRLHNGYRWWLDEQPSDEIKQRVDAAVDKGGFDVILSHTCPFHYQPTEMFLQQIDQDGVDKSTELWLGEVEKRAKYKVWYCGHWHTNKHIDKIHFLYDSFETVEPNLEDAD